MILFLVGFLIFTFLASQDMAKGGKQAPHCIVLWYCQGHKRPPPCHFLAHPLQDETLRGSVHRTPWPQYRSQRISPHLNPARLFHAQHRGHPVPTLKMGHGPQVECLCSAQRPHSPYAATGGGNRALLMLGPNACF